MHSARQEYEEKLTELERHCTLLQSDISASDFLALLEQMEALRHIAQRIFTYAELLSREDSLDEGVAAFRSEITQFFADGVNREDCFWSWWRSLDDANAERLAEHSPAYRRWLLNIRSRAAITPTLDAGPPGGLTRASVLPDLVNRYDRLATQTRIAGNDGAGQQYSQDRDVRVRAHQEVRRMYGNQEEHFGTIYREIVHAWHRENVDLSLDHEPISAVNRANDIDDEVINGLLRFSDMTAPNFSTAAELEFPTASENLLEAYRGFNPQLEDLAERVYSERHIDSVPGGKRAQGGMSTSVAPDTTSWVTLPYIETFESMSLLAHEMGHAVHFMLVDHHSDLMHRASHLVGETAAAFSEILYFEEMLRGTKDASERRTLLTTRLLTLNQAIMTTSYTALFEIEAHQLILQGAPANTLSRLYRSKLIEQYGDSMRVDRHFGFDWMRTPHIFHGPFSMYVYPFGQLLALAMYRRYLAEGQDFVVQYVGVLKRGGDTQPPNLLDLARGEDPSLDVWQAAFDVIADMVSAACTG
jgi:oligoendopeptidase F